MVRRGKGVNFNGSLEYQVITPATVLRVGLLFKMVRSVLMYHRVR